MLKDMKPSAYDLEKSGGANDMSQQIDYQILFL